VLCLFASIRAHSGSWSSSVETHGYGKLGSSRPRSAWPDFVGGKGSVSAVCPPQLATRVTCTRVECLHLLRRAATPNGKSSVAVALRLPSDLSEGGWPRVRIAGRVVSRREGGKVYFLDIKDRSGEPTLREMKGERETKFEELPDWTSRGQVMVGQRQGGDVGW